MWVSRTAHARAALRCLRGCAADCFATDAPAALRARADATGCAPRAAHAVAMTSDAARDGARAQGRSPEGAALGETTRSTARVRNPQATLNAHAPLLPLLLPCMAADARTRVPDAPRRAPPSALPAAPAPAISPASRRAAASHPHAVAANDACCTRCRLGRGCARCRGQLLLDGGVPVCQRPRALHCMARGLGFEQRVLLFRCRARARGAVQPTVASLVQRVPCQPGDRLAGSAVVQNSFKELTPRTSSSSVLRLSPTGACCNGCALRACARASALTRAAQTPERCRRR